MNDITRTTADLSGYLNIIFDEEILLDQQKTILQQLKAHMPTKEQVTVPKEMELSYHKSSSGTGIIGSVLVFFHLCLPVAGIAFLIAGVFASIFLGEYEGALGFVVTVVVVAEIALMIFIGKVAGDSEEKETEQRKIEQRKIEQNQIDIKKAIWENKRLDKEYQSKLAMWNDAIRNIENRIVEIQNVLGLIYSDNIIYIKYRNLVAISALKEYIESGRAKSLAEAYDRFELEHRLDNMQSTLNKIDDKLNLVLDKLDDLSYELRSALKQNSDRSKKFNLEMTEYMNAVIANQQAQQENLVLIKNDQQCIAENTKVLGYIKNTQQRTFDMSPFIKMYNNKIYQ